jgi:hypothetical protein CLOSPO_02616
MSQYQYIDKVYNEERRLIQQAERDKRLVFFVGAGASIPSGMPSWKEAIEIIRERMNVAPQDDFLKIPQYYYVQYGKRDYTRLMREVFKHKKMLSPNDIHHEIFKFQVSTIVTTNYDYLLEEAAKAAYRVVDVISQDSDLVYGFAESKIIKMHGDFEHDNFVLKEEDYLNYAQNFRLLTAYIKALIAGNTLVFIGYSFNDPDLKQIFSWVKEILGRDMPRSYMIVADRPYSEMEVNYFKAFGVELLYAARKIIAYETLKIEKRTLGMLEFLRKEEDISELDKIYQFLIPFQDMNYVHLKYIERAFRLIWVHLHDNKIMIDDACDKGREILYGIRAIAAEQVALFRERYEVPEKDIEKYQAIYEVLVKSSAYFLVASADREHVMKIPDETEILRQRAISADRIMRAVMSYNMAELRRFRHKNKELLSERNPLLYMEQAALSYHLLEYAEAYEYLKKAALGFYQEEQFGWYFIAQMNQKYLANMISQGVSLGGTSENGKRIQKEAKNIDLDKIFYSLPQIGFDQNEFLRELYTMQLFYIDFISAHDKSEEAEEEAQTSYVMYVKTPSISQLWQQVMDSWSYVIKNYVFVDRYREFSRSLQLYAQTVLTTITTPDIPSEKGALLIGECGNIKVSELTGNDVFFILRYCSAKNMERILSKADMDLISVAQDGQERLECILNNIQQLDGMQRNEIFEKILILLYYIPLTTELIAMILHELTQRVSSIDFRSRANKVANLFSRIARQKYLSKKHEECISLLHEYLDSILRAIIGGRIDKNGACLVLSYGLSLYKGIQNEKFASEHISSLMQEKYLYVLDVLYPYVDGAARRGIRSLAGRKKWEWDIAAMELFCRLLQSGILKSTVKLEEAFFDFAKTIKDDRGKGYPSQYENALVYITNANLSGCFKQKDKAREFIQKSGISFYDWIFDWEDFDYAKFNVDWLARCAENLLKTIGENVQVRKKIQEAVRKQYLDGHINASAMRRYFEIFAV